MMRHLQFFLLKFHENCCFFKPIFCENFAIAAVQKHAHLVEPEKCCQTQLLSKAWKIAVNVLIQPRTSPPKICKIKNENTNFANRELRPSGGTSRRPAPRPAATGPRRRRARPAAGRRGSRTPRPRGSLARTWGETAKWANFVIVFAKFCKFLAGSFSAVSKRNFARQENMRLTAFFKLYKICIL